MPTRWRALAVAGLVLTGSARPAAADWTFAAFLGAAHTQTSSLRIEQPALGTRLAFDPVAYRSESFAAPVYYGYRLGRRLPFAPAFWVEAEFIHAKLYTDPGATVRVTGVERGQAVSRTQPLGRTVERFSISHGENFVLGNLVWRPGPSEAAGGRRVQLVVRAGAGLTVPHPESTVVGESVDHYELGSFAWHAAGGLEVRVAKGLHALGEYKFTRVAERVTIAGGEARTVLATHHLVFGAGYRF